MGELLGGGASIATSVPPITGKVATATTVAVGSGVTGDAGALRWSDDGAGTRIWGPGDGTFDTRLQRTAAQTLSLDGNGAAVTPVFTSTRTLHLRPASGLSVGFTNNAGSNWALQVTDGANPTVGLFGKAPVGQAGAIAAPTAPGAVYVQAEAASAKTAIDAIRAALTGIGITA